MPVDQRFFQIIDGITAHDLAARLGASIHGSRADQIITGVAPLALAAEGDVTYQTAGLSTYDAPGRACIIITTAEIAAELDSDQISLIVDHPRRSFASALGMIVQEVEPDPDKTSVDRSAQIHPEATIKDGVVIGADTVVEAGAVIQSGVVIGTDCYIGANSVLSHCDIADHVTIGACTVIGDSGFGFEMTPDGAIRLPHAGIVRIADGCSIGSHCCIDRGSLEDTALGRSVMIDNMCHIAHNVQIGDRTVMAAQCGVSGSVKIGADVQIGGQVGIAQHVTIGDGAVLTARSGVTKDVVPQTQMAGFPAIEAGQYWRERAALRRLTKSSGAPRHNIKAK